MGKEGGVDGTTELEGTTIELEISEEEDLTGPEEDIILEGGKVTLVGAVVEIVQPSLDLDKDEMIVGKAIETTDKGEIEESGDRVEIQRSKEGWTEEMWIEESEEDVGRIGKSDSWKRTCGVI